MVCIFCKSKYHDYRSCPVLYKLQRQRELSASMKQDYFGQSPNVFIGRFGYPHVRVGILGAEEYDKNDDPKAWSREGTPIPEIIRLRSALINSYFQAQIKGSQDRFGLIARDVSVAKRPVDVEVSLQKKPHFRLTFETDLAPHGPTVPLRFARITENIPIDTRVEKAVSADDLTAGDAITQLARKGIDEHSLVKAFSMGNFGIPIERRLVPTRWSITAVDDIRGKQLLQEIHNHNPTDCVAHFGGHLGNHYLILFFDDVWQYELFEQFVPSNRTADSDVNIETDYEPYEGRKEYVHETAGGYYAARIGILEHLAARRRQASVLAIRIITEEYTAPLGVWVVREAVRKALGTEQIRFPDRNAMIRYAQSFLWQRFGYDIKPLLARSRLVKALWGQRKLSDFQR